MENNKKEQKEEFMKRRGKSPNRIYVIAGSYKEFLFYTKNNSKYKYISSPIELFGLPHKANVKLFGTYYMRKDWEQIRLQLLALDANILEGVL